MADDPLYEERVSSVRTQGLFWGLTVLFLFLSMWRRAATGWTPLPIALLLVSLFFLFCALNYRTLIIRLTTDRLRLRFGLFGWTIPLREIEDCRLDDSTGIARYGGAGIHFLFVRRRYRASFNFLEYPRVLIALKGPRLVRDVSFTTRQPEKLLELLETRRPASVRQHLT